MSTSLNKVTGNFYVSEYMLPNLDDDTLYDLLLSSVKLSDIILTKNPFIFRIDNKSISRNTDNSFVSIEYSLYFENHLYCPLNELLHPEYFENYYDDMDAEFNYGDVVPVSGIGYIVTEFKKEKVGWRRVK